MCSYPTGHESVSASKLLTGDWWNEWHEFAVEHTESYVAYVVDNEVCAPVVDTCILLQKLHIQ